ncbi:L-rhamnose mutarotase [Variovorax sp. ZS18.2.2]|uniref:L-rhamnose mutarotase n=1 Tax=Variovorax sp. ZS18.2.2 TaxID=2971255 RepID=UPI0021512C6D|nr:L-rhamnose mutarotase [Variovorax sp. ZS18.2.2]MCR6479362.1 L-rhamnose mutarotase [Variovorax sp. ZS18.2.2]
MRHCLALDLKDDPVLIAEYEAYHRNIWPEVRAHLDAQGVTGMEIYRLGTRMVMLMETDDARYDAEAMALASQNNPKIREWEALMWRFQAATPWTPEGEKWVAMDRIFEL